MKLDLDKIVSEEEKYQIVAEVTLGNSWGNKLVAEFKKDYFKSLFEFLAEEYKQYEVYPPKKEVFKAYRVTPFEDVKVVIIGQDPYPNKDEAMGLSFSVKEDIKTPKSLNIIKKSIIKDIFNENPEISLPNDLTYLAKQGFFLLNTVLTVRAKEIASHYNKGWEQFTSETLKVLMEKEQPVLFVGMGKKAQITLDTIRNSENIKINENSLFLYCEHPAASAYSGKPWNNNNIFVEIDNFYKKYYNLNLDWNVKSETTST
jgi:uracil-DNA glycosylase